MRAKLSRGMRPVFSQNTIIKSYYYKVQNCEEGEGNGEHPKEQRQHVIDLVIIWIIIRYDIVYYLIYVDYYFDICYYLLKNIVFFV